MKQNFKCECGKILKCSSKNKFKDEINFVFEPCNCKTKKLSKELNELKQEQAEFWKEIDDITGN